MEGRLSLPALLLHAQSTQCTLQSENRSVTELCLTPRVPQRAAAIAESAPTWKSHARIAESRLIVGDLGNVVLVCHVATPQVLSGSFVGGAGLSSVTRTATAVTFSAVAYAAKVYPISLVIDADTLLGNAVYTLRLRRCVMRGGGGERRRGVRALCTWMNQAIRLLFRGEMMCAATGSNNTHPSLCSAAQHQQHGQVGAGLLRRRELHHQRPAPLGHAGGLAPERIRAADAVRHHRRQVRK